MREALGCRAGVARILAVFKPHRSARCDLLWDGMVSVLPLPDWVPAWVHAVVLCSGALLALAFVILPFAVFGTKTRLEAIEARLDEVQGEIRSLSLRLPEPVGQIEDVEAYPAASRLRPPIPPPPRIANRPAPNPVPPPPAQRTAARTEPRLY